MDDKDLKNKKDEDQDQEVDNKVTEKSENDLKTELESLKKIANSFEDAYKRALADYQNLQRRNQTERQGIIVSANNNLVLKFLPILDILIMAVKHFKDQSLQFAIDEFLKVLESVGVEKIKTVGEIFDPKTMECIETKNGKKNWVLEEIRLGFRLGEDILRPAQVVVGKEEN